jgi:sugar phosphate isomerase/epimerase
LSKKEKLAEIRKAFRYCQILESPTLRIFSGLMIDSKPNLNFYEDERELYEEVSVLSEKYNINVGLENEPESNINSLNHLKNFRQLVPTDSFGLLLDIGNLYYVGEKPNEKDLMGLLDYTIPNYHIKDYSSKYNSYIELGKGDIPYRNLLRLILENKEQNKIFLTLEPHLAKSSYKEIENSILHLRNILEDFNFINYPK